MKQNTDDGDKQHGQDRQDEGHLYVDAALAPRLPPHDLPPRGHDNMHAVSDAGHVCNADDDPTFLQQGDTCVTMTDKKEHLSRKSGSHIHGDASERQGCEIYRERHNKARKVDTDDQDDMMRKRACLDDMPTCKITNLPVTVTDGNDKFNYIQSKLLTASAGQGSYEHNDTPSMMRNHAEDQVTPSDSFIDAAQRRSYKSDGSGQRAPEEGTTATPISRQDPLLLPQPADLWSKHALLRAALTRKRQRSYEHHLDDSSSSGDDNRSNYHKRVKRRFTAAARAPAVMQISRIPPTGRNGMRCSVLDDLPRCCVANYVVTPPPEHRALITSECAPRLEKTHCASARVQKGSHFAASHDALLSPDAPT